jgi:hypothetical protein
METTKTRVIEESQKTYFHKGDVVKFKGVDNEPFEMKVANIVWATDNNGTLKTNNGKKVIEGILVEWMDSFGQMQYKLVDSRSIYKVDYEGQYHLVEAKKFFVKNNMTKIVEKINELLNKVM